MKLSLLAQTSQSTIPIILLSLSTSLSAYTLPSIFERGYANSLDQPSLLRIQNQQRGQEQPQQQQILSLQIESSHEDVIPPLRSGPQVIFSSPLFTTPSTLDPASSSLPISGTITMHHPHRSQHPHLPQPQLIPLRFTLSPHTCPHLPRCVVSDVASQFITDLPLGFALPPLPPLFLSEDSGEVVITEEIHSIEDIYGGVYRATAEIRLKSMREGGGGLGKREWLDLVGLIRKALLEILRGVDVEMGRGVRKMGVRDTRVEGVLGDVRFEATWRFWVVGKHRE